MPYDEPNMSDTTLLVSVEDLINIAMGPPDVNVINFKVIQTVLHILARQQRMLHQRVEIRITERREETPPAPRRKKSAKRKEVDEGSLSSSPRSPLPKKRIAAIKEKRADQTKDIKPERDKEKPEREAKKKEDKEKAREEKEKAKLEKEKEREERGQRKQEKEKEREEKEKAKQEKEKEREERKQEKEKGKEEKEKSRQEKEREREEREQEKEKEREERGQRKQDKEKEREEKEKAKQEKEKEREERKQEKEKGKEEKEKARQEKEREREEREQEKEKEREERGQRKQEKEKEREEKEKSKQEKEKEREERKQEKEKGKEEKEKARQEKEREREEREQEKEKEREERGQRKQEKEKEREEKEKARQEKEREREEREQKKQEKDKEREDREQRKQEREQEKEKEREGRKQEKEKEREEKDKAKQEKEKEREERKQEKEKEREDKDKAKQEKERERDERKQEKEKGKEEKEKARQEKEKEREERDQRKQEKEKDREEREQRKQEKEQEELKAKADKSARKEKEKAEKEQQKELEKLEKEKGKAEKAAAKEQSKAEKAAEKEREKAEKAAEKEREKAEKASEKEKEKSQKASEKEREKAEKSERKERERAEKEAEKQQKEKEKSQRSPSPGATLKGKKKARVESVSSISITEVDRGKEKVLVVEKGPTTRSEIRSRGSIDVVTQSQFALLEAAVQSLARQTAPPAQLRLPDNERLKSDLARGSASLTDTMQAMQVYLQYLHYLHTSPGAVPPPATVDARVKAAEAAIERMADLLTQLASAGAMPDALAEEAARVAERVLTSDTDEGMPIKPRPSTATRKSVAIDPMAKASELDRPRASAAGSVSTVLARPSILSRPSSTVSSVAEPKVTRSEMDDIIKAVKADLVKSMNAMTGKATVAAETALNTAKGVAEKLDVALKLDSRISSLQALVSDYAEQLSGFDVGLTTQMQSFQEQMAQMRSDLRGGLQLLESANNNAETAAVMELTERYEDLASELQRTTSAHRTLAAFQSKLGGELQSLVECVEMLREQKADRDEVIDGLRDKADLSRLAGLLTEAEFARARAELARRLDVCHDKFRRQDAVWMGAIKDLLKTTDLKAEIIDLLSLKDDTQRQLRELQERVRVLAAALGEPQAALLTRQLAAGAACGACGGAALMGLRDPSTGIPPALPALRPAPAGEPAPCLRDWLPEEAPDDRHMCLRWVGGSHTLVSEHTTRGEAPPMLLHAVPTRKFADYGQDGRLYMMEEEMQPCVECNALLPERPPPAGQDGAGDQGPIQPAITDA